jgi:pyridinium-3,5-bisthiocarboxylic acid mononucleotide nickel chelatase
MTLGALIDAGVPAELLREGIRSMEIGDVDLVVETVKKCGFRATHVKISHTEQKAHRHLHHIDALIDGAGGIAEDAKSLAKQIFLELGKAEAHVHNSTLQKVHFHEVGAIDSIADIVGTAIGMRWLGLDAVEASAIPTGTGFIEIDHGRVSVPAPATAELLRGIPLSPSEVPFELTTPTGAAILKTTARRFGALPAMRIEAIGYGAGTRDLPGQPNVLRLLIGEVDDPATKLSLEVDHVMVLETNIDSSTGEDMAGCVAKLWQAGAIDVFQTTCLMKKGRMGTQVTVLAAASRAGELESILFTHGGTIGIRRELVQRHKLIRKSHTVETRIGPIQGKCVWLPEQRWRFAVEYDQAAELASAHGTTIEAVRTMASTAFESEPSPEPPTSLNRA